MHSILIPASGSATRMRGLPKFLLPSGIDDLSLLEVHISNVINFASEILIGLNPIFFDIFMKAGLQLHGASVFPMETSTMTETVLNLAAKSNSQRYTVLMPDTAFSSGTSYQFANMNHDLDLSLWRIRLDQYGKLGQVSLTKAGKVIDCIDKDLSCVYEHAWGALTFNHKFIDVLRPDFPHIGYGIVPALKANLDVFGTIVDGSYWDCGTPGEYIRYLKSKES
jgi:hypothetical protein